MTEAGPGLPVVDVSAIVGGGDPGPAARAIDAACREVGFFYVVGHGVDENRQRHLEALAAEFFSLPDEEKAEIAMARAGRAWRGWFPVGGELTSGIPDRKEGLYFGADGDAGDPRAMHGPNLFPARPAGLREAVLGHLAAMTALGHAVLGGVALGLGLDRSWFRRAVTADPVVLFRIFYYPPAEPAPEAWGVGEHTDYGLLTMLRQDATPGLEVRAVDGSWIAAPPLAGSFVCNVGDMLDRMTGGRYRSTAHRARNESGVGRLSFPFFFDPSWDAVVRPIPLDDEPPADDAERRWDRTSVHALDGRPYGDYLTAKVSKVFPDLG